MLDSAGASQLSLWASRSGPALSRRLHLYSHPRKWFAHYFLTSPASSSIDWSIVAYVLTRWERCLETGWNWFSLTTANISFEAQKEKWWVVAAQQATWVWCPLLINFKAKKNKAARNDIIWFRMLVRNWSIPLIRMTWWHRSIDWIGPSPEILLHAARVVKSMNGCSSVAELQMGGSQSRPAAGGTTRQSEALHTNQARKTVVDSQRCGRPFR